MFDFKIFAFLPYYVKIKLHLTEFKKIFYAKAGWPASLTCERGGSADPSASRGTSQVEIETCTFMQSKVCMHTRYTYNTA